MSGVMKFFGLDKVAKLANIVKQHGGLRASLYHLKHGVDYDGSMVPAEWFGWLHYKTDKPPTEKAPVAHPWIQEHTANTSGSSAGSSTLMGSSNAYMPYTTTKPKIESWVPPKN